MVIDRNQLKKLSKSIGLDTRKLFLILKSCNFLYDLINMKKDELKTPQGKLRISLFNEIMKLNYR